MSILTTNITPSQNTTIIKTTLPTPQHPSTPNFNKPLNYIDIPPSPTQIYYCSRTHSQLKQFVNEVLNSPYSHTKTTSLASRMVGGADDDVHLL